MRFRPENLGILVLDAARRDKEVAEIVESDFFRHLEQRASQLRAKTRGDDGAEPDVMGDAQAFRRRDYSSEEPAPARAGRIVSIHSFRGGTGKSNSTANLAVLLARQGLRVGVIDTDIQSPGIHVLFQCDPADFKYALNDYLWGRCEIQDAAVDVTARGAARRRRRGRVRGQALPGAVEPRRRRHRARAARRLRRRAARQGVSRPGARARPRLPVDRHPSRRQRGDAALDRDLRPLPAPAPSRRPGLPGHFGDARAGASARRGGNQGDPQQGSARHRHRRAQGSRRVRLRRPGDRDPAAVARRGAARQRRRLRHPLPRPSVDDRARGRRPRAAGDGAPGSPPERASHERDGRTEGSGIGRDERRATPARSTRCCATRAPRCRRCAAPSRRSSSRRAR